MNEHRMRKPYRVKTERDFQKVFQTRNSFANRKFIVYTLEKADQSHFRVGISVGKKVGNAVHRNAVKRKIRASIQSIDTQDGIKDALDFIVIARPGVSELSYQEVYSNLKHVFALAGIIK